MSGKATTGAAAKKIELTPREVEVLAAAWQSFKSDPEIDIAKLSQLVGFQNPRSAANLMGQIKKKLTAMETSGNFSVAAAPKATAPKAKPSGAAATRGAATSTSARGNRAAAAAKRKSAAAAEDAGAEADNEASEATPGPQKRRATGRGRKAAKSPTPVKEEEVYEEEDGDDEGASASSADDKAQVLNGEVDGLAVDEASVEANVVKDEFHEQPEAEGQVKDEADEEPKPKTKTKKIRDENDPITMFTNLNDTSDEDDI